MSTDAVKQRLIYVRELIGHSRADIANITGIPLRSIKNWESGRTENIPHYYLVAIVKLGIDANWLLLGTGIPMINSEESSLESAEILSTMDTLNHKIELKQYQYISDIDIASMLDININTIRTWRRRGVGPAYIKGSGTKGIIKYKLQDVLDWINESKIVVHKEDGKPVKMPRKYLKSKIKD